MAQVMRDSRAADVSFATGSSPDVNQAAPGAVNPDFMKHKGETGTVAGTNIEVKDTSVLDNLVGSLSKIGTEFFAKKMNTAKEEAYLDGQAAAASGKARDVVDSDIFTKDWATAGWSDTKSRLGLADADAQTATDMKKLREQPPEKMKEYLQNRRTKLMPMMEGMSLEARKAMMGQMALSDQHAIATHMTAYQKFIVDTQAKAVQTSFSVASAAMDAAKNDPVAYATATDNAMVNIWGNVVQNPNLPPEMKPKMIEEAAIWALDNNHEQFFEKLQNTKDPSGTTMLDNLDFGTRSKLVKAYQASRKDTATMRNGAYNTQLGLYQSKLDDPLAPAVSWEDHQAIIGQGVQLGVIDGPKQASMAKQWGDANGKKAKSVGLAAAWAAGDINGMFSLGGDDEEGADAYLVTRQRKGDQPAQVAGDLALIGLNTGSAAAFKRVGKLMRSSIAMIGVNDNIDPGQLAGVNSVMDVVDKAYAKGNEGAKTAFLSSFDEATQARLLTFRDGMSTGLGAVGAAKRAATMSADNDKLSPADRAAMGANHATENAKLIAEIEPKGLFAQAWEKVVPDAFRSKNNIAIDKLRAPRDGIIGWRDNIDVVEEAQSRAKVALLGELNDISRAQPYMSAESRKTMALTKVANRTVVTNGGPVILPQGQTIQTYFGIPQSMSADIVSSALNSMHEPGKGNRVTYTVAADGRMQWQEKSKDNLLVNAGGVFDPKEIAGVIQAEQDKRTEKFIQTDGAGKRVNGPDGSSVRFNGDNTVGVGTNVMLQVRNDLVKHEGVRSKPYDDASGKIVNGKRVQTVGVGVSSHNPFYPKVQEDGSVLPSDINRSFMLASDAALKQANEYLQDLPKDRQNTYATRLLTSLTYQGGSVNDGLRKALAGNDRAAAEKLLKASPQYKMSHDDRKRFYDQMFNGVMPYNQNF